jgi:hypothetical protein
MRSLKLMTLVAVLLAPFWTTGAIAKSRSHHPCVAAAPTPGWGMIGPDRRYVPLAQRVMLYQQLRLGWIRVGALIPPSGGSGLTSVEDTSAFRSVGLKTFLTVYGMRFRTPGAIQPDYDTFGANLKWVIEQYHPDMIVVENEADNPPYTEAADEYLKEVKTACGIAHVEGIQCTDSGMTTKMVLALIVKNYLLRGDVAHANYYARYLRLWFPMHFMLDPTGPELSQMLENAGASRAEQILKGLRSAGADRVNLHWYVRPGGGFPPREHTELLVQAIMMMRGVSGLPVVGGEVGMDLPHGSDVTVDPAPFVAMMNTMANLGVSPLIVWDPGSGLFGQNQNARSLVDAQGNLLTLGKAYLQLTHSRPYPDGISKTCK